MKIFLRYIHLMHRLLIDMNYGDRFKIDHIEFDGNTNDYLISYIPIGKRRLFQQRALDIYKNESLIFAFSRKDVAEIARFAGESIEKKKRNRSIVRNRG